MIFSYSMLFLMHRQIKMSDPLIKIENQDTERKYNIYKGKMLKSHKNPVYIENARQKNRDPDYVIPKSSTNTENRRTYTTRKIYHYGKETQNIIRLIKAQQPGMIKTERICKKCDDDYRFPSKLKTTNSLDKHLCDRCINDFMAKIKSVATDSDSISSVILSQTNEKDHDKFTDITDEPNLCECINCKFLNLKLMHKKKFLKKSKKTNLEDKISKPEPLYIKQEEDSNSTNSNSSEIIETKKRSKNDIEVKKKLPKYYSNNISKVLTDDKSELKQELEFKKKSWDWDIKKRIVTNIKHIRKSIKIVCETNKVFKRNIVSIENGKLNPLENEKLRKHISEFVQAKLDNKCTDFANLHCYDEIKNEFAGLSKANKREIDVMCQEVKTYIDNGCFSFKVFYKIITDCEIKFKWKDSQSAIDILKKITNIFTSNFNNSANLFPQYENINKYFEIVGYDKTSLINKKETFRHAFCLLLSLKLLNHNWFTLFENQNILNENAPSTSHDFVNMNKEKMTLAASAFFTIRIELGKLLTYSLIPFLRPITRYDLVVMMTYEELFSHKVCAEIYKYTEIQDLKDGLYFFNVSKLFFAFDLVESEFLVKLNKKEAFEDFNSWFTINKALNKYKEDYRIFNINRIKLLATITSFQKDYLTTNRSLSFMTALKIYHDIFLCETNTNLKPHIIDDNLFQLVIKNIQTKNKQVNQGIKNETQLENLRHESNQIELKNQFTFTEIENKIKKFCDKYNNGIEIFLFEVKEIYELMMTSGIEFLDNSFNLSHGKNNTT